MPHEVCNNLPQGHVFRINVCACCIFYVIIILIIRIIIIAIIIIIIIKIIQHLFLYHISSHCGHSEALYSQKHLHICPYLELFACIDGCG